MKLLNEKYKRILKPFCFYLEASMLETVVKRVNRKIQPEGFPIYAPR